MDRQSLIIKDIFAGCAGKQELKIILIELINHVLMEI